MTNLLIGYQTGLIKPTGSMTLTVTSRAAAGNLQGHCGFISAELPRDTIGKRYRVILIEEEGDEHSGAVSAAEAAGSMSGGLG